MGDLRPLGSERLQGTDKIKRIMEIATYKETPKTTLNETTSFDYSIRLADGNLYAIVKEKSGYILKKGLNESTMDYMDSITERKHYRSYSEAMKRLNLTAAEANRLYGKEEGISLIGEQEGQKKKFVLKVPKSNKTPDVGSPEPITPPAEPTPATTAPAPPAEVPSPTNEPTGTEEPMDMGTEEPMDMGTEEPTGTEEPMDMGDDEFDLGSEDDEDKKPSFKSIQRLVGKLSQRLRTIEKEKELESDDIKYVLNSILSAIDLDSLDEDDREDILSKFDEDESEYGAEEPGELDLSGEEDFDLGGEEEPMDMEEPKEVHDSIFGESVVEQVLQGYFEIKPEEQTLLEEKKKRQYIKDKLDKIEVKKQLTKLSESVEQLDMSIKTLNNGGKFIGKTNKLNLIFIKEGKQIKINQKGRLL